MGWSHLRRNCSQKYGFEGKIEERIEVTGRWKRRRKQLLHNVKETIRYWTLKQEALDGSLWRAHL
jgi:hypothetical protein